VTSPSSTLNVRVLQVAYDDLEPVPDRVARVAQLVEEQCGADLVVLPELWAVGGFAFESWEERAETLEGPTVAALSASAEAIGATVHMGSLIERAAGSPAGMLTRHSHRRWNTSVLLGPDGSILTTYRKIHRFGFSVGETALLDPGDRVVRSVVHGGDPSHSLLRLGLATCYDLRFPELFRLLVDLGCDAFVVPAAWPAARVEHWELLGRARALENQCFVIQCNTAGSHGGIEMGGGSQVIGPDGRVLAQAGAEQQVIEVDLDPSEVARYREAFPVLGDRRLIDPPSSQDPAACHPQRALTPACT
jgi:predicted amidohydrolase